MSLLSFLFGAPGRSFFEKRWYEGSFFIINFPKVDVKSDFYLPAVTPSLLDKTMRYLAKTFNIISLSQIAEALEQRTSLPKRAAAITFELGYANLHKSLLPILKALRVPVTIYLPTRLIGTDEILWTDEAGLFFQRLPSRAALSLENLNLPLTWADNESKEIVFENFMMRLKKMEPKERTSLWNKFKEIAPVQDKSHTRQFLNWNEVQDLVSAGADIGSSGATYTSLTKLTTNEIAGELRESKSIIEEKTGTKCVNFSYPGGEKGDIDTDSEKYPRDAGYRTAITNFPGLNSRLAFLFSLQAVKMNTKSLGDLGTELKKYHAAFREIKDDRERYRVIRGYQAQ